MPERIQRKRARGWRMPENTAYVGRGSIWGNPFSVGAPSGVFDGKDGRGLGIRDQVEILIPAVDLETSIQFYRDLLSGFIQPEMYPHGHDWRTRFGQKIGGCHPSEWARGTLRGKNLACWCELGAPCHADILLEIANK